ncbi:MAG: Lrp/AsnC family transcriptional regulator [Betaproteobacteria bacterium]|nr:Lrp/AsnC family transcriptional regulator [Betaproteobacteria bacterium]
MTDTHEIRDPKSEIRNPKSEIRNHSDFRLLNDWQRGFPLSPRPYAELAHRLGRSEAEVIARLGALAAEGAVSRIGAVFRPHTLGWSTLAAVSAPAGRIDDLARIISAYPEVNHNYEREHAFNLWFVATAPSPERVAQVLAEIGRAAGGPVLDLPMQEDFHIDLGFDLGSGREKPAARPHFDPLRRVQETPPPLESADYALAAALEGGLTLTPRPYAALAATLGVSEEAVLARLARLLDLGVIRRFGIVVRHRELGYAANAMVVWDVPDDAVAVVGRFLAGQRAVTLCYRRPRRLPDWRYNLFSMVHGQDRQAVLAEVARMQDELGREHGPLACQPLFSRRRFKQCGARYSSLAKAA